MLAIIKLFAWAWAGVACLILFFEVLTFILEVFR